MGKGQGIDIIVLLFFFCAFMQIIVDLNKWHKKSKKDKKWDEEIKKEREERKRQMEKES
jgi:hypothetical protein